MLKSDWGSNAKREKDKCLKESQEYACSVVTKEREEKEKKEREAHETL